MIHIYTWEREGEGEREKEGKGERSWKRQILFWYKYAI